jgi:hypothetical protein
VADITAEHGDLIVHLSPWEKIGALSGDVRVPQAAVRRVRISSRPLAEIRGLRVVGTGLPRVIALGTWRRRRGRKDFAAVYRKREGVVIDLDERMARYSRLIVSVHDAEATMTKLVGASPSGWAAPSVP